MSSYIKKNPFLFLSKYLGERDMVWSQDVDKNPLYCICSKIFAAVQMGMGKKLIHHFRYVWHLREFWFFPRHKADWRISCSRAGIQWLIGLPNGSSFWMSGAVVHFIFVALYPFWSHFATYGRKMSRHLGDAQAFVHYW